MVEKYSDILWVDKQIAELEAKLIILKQFRNLYLIEEQMQLLNGHAKPVNGIQISHQTVFNVSPSKLGKVIQFIREKNKFVITDEITSYLLPSYPARGKKLLRADVSKLLYEGKKDNKIVSVEKDRSRREGFLWGLPEWLDENSNPIKEFMPKKKAPKEASK
jgi:hypothetical protein